MKDATKILKRHSENPIITREDIDGAMVVFNPSPVMYEGKTILLLSVYDFASQHRAGGRVARSADGIHFEIDEQPFVDYRSRGGLFERIGGHIDSRITPVEDAYYLLTPAFCEGEGPFIVMGKTRDFTSYEPLEIVGMPPNRGSSLFPEKINGKYCRLDRPGAGDDTASIWLSFSPDLTHWGCHRPLLKPGYAKWNRIKIGPTPPLKTPEGWLVIVHGVFSWTVADRHYYIGAMLLDLEDPSRIIGKTQSWLLAAEEDYEVRGQVDNVVFPCGAIADVDKDELRIYYGAADTCVGLASGSLAEVLEACKRGI